MVEAMNDKAFVKYLERDGLTPEESVAGHRVWNSQIKDEYAKAVTVLRDLGLIH